MSGSVIFSHFPPTHANNRNDIHVLFEDETMLVTATYLSTFEPCPTSRSRFYGVAADRHQHCGALKTCNHPRNGSPQNTPKFLKLQRVVCVGVYTWRTAVTYLVRRRDWVEIICFERGIYVVPREMGVLSKKKRFALYRRWEWLKLCPEISFETFDFCYN